MGTIPQLTEYQQKLIDNRRLSREFCIWAITMYPALFTEFVDIAIKHIELRNYPAATHTLT